TDTAPACSAILACSAFVTSMITPPLSISARPVLTRSVATSAITLDCTARAAARPRPIPGTWLAALGEEAGDGVRERPRLLDEDEVPAVGEQHELGTVDTRSDLARVHGAADEVVLAGDHERLRPDPRQLRQKVEGPEHLVVEQLERVADRDLLLQRPDVLALGVAVGREVERQLAQHDPGQLLVGLPVAGLLLLERRHPVLEPGLVRPK